MTPSKLFVAGLVPLLLILSVACGGGDSDDSGDGSSGSSATEAPDGSGGEPEDTATSEPSGGGSAPSGSATLTIGDESWTFVVFFCGFSPEEIGNEAAVFSLVADGETSDGVRLRLFVDIIDMTGTALTEAHSVEMYDAGNFSDPSIAWTAFQPLIRGDDEEGFVRVDGKRVTAEYTFDSDLTEDDREEIPGTLVATCP